MKKNKIQIQIISVVMGVISLLVFYHVNFVLNEYSRDLENIKKDFMKESDNLPKILETSIKNTYILISKILMNDQKIMEALRDRDREKLFALVDLIYQKALINSHDALKVFHFYLPNNQSFLRMHQPSMHSDFANDRQTVVGVNKSKELISGFEVGKFGFFYRVEIPLFYKGEYLGMLDIGIDFISILNETNNLYSSKQNNLALLLDESSSKVLLKQANDLTVGSFLVHYTTSEIFKKLFQEKLSTDVDHVYKVDGKSYVLYIKDIFGANNNLIAKIAYAYDLTDEKEYLDDSIITTIIISLFILLSVYFILSISLNSIFKKLQRSNEEIKKLSMLVENTADSIYIVGKNGVFEYINPAFESFTGYSTAEIIGKTPRILKSGYHSDEFYKILWLTILSGKVFKGSFVNKKKNGDIYYEDKTITPVKDENGEVLYFLVTGKDITKEKLANKKLETERKEHQAKIENINKNLQKRVEEEVQKRAEQENLLIEQSRLAGMGEMIGNIAHQWRQPLNALSLVIGNIKDAYSFGKLDDARLNKAVEKSNMLIQKMSSTIDDFRDFFKPDKEKKEFSIEEAIDDTMNLLEAGFAQNNIEVEKDFAENTLINGFYNEFSQVILNILNNAKDALIENKIENPVIKITTTQENGKAYLTIEDNAGGIPDAIIGRIFEPYFTTKEQGKGTGIGLYMSKTIIQGHMNGKLSVKNGENGALFTIKINSVDGEKYE